MAKKIAVLVSGGGTNLQALIDAYPFICLWLWFKTWEDVCPQGTLGKSLGTFCSQRWGKGCVWPVG